MIENPNLAQRTIKGKEDKVLLIRTVEKTFEMLHGNRNF